MTLGRAPEQADLLRSTVSFCKGKLSPTSIYGLLFRECHNLFPDDAFADLYEDIGRRSVPPRIVAVVMVLQRLDGLSDREAVDRFTFDARWKYAAGGLDFEHEGFVHTVLVDMRARLRDSERPDRIFEIALDVAKKAGMVGRRRVLDSTPLYDAVATQDTVTMIRSAIRGLLRVADASLVTELRGVLQRDDAYATAGKPACDWEDTLHEARTRQKAPEWRANYKATRPKVERKLAHLMRRRHGGRRARMRGRERVAQDFKMLCAAVNLQRLARFELRSVDARVAAAVA